MQKGSVPGGFALNKYNEVFYSVLKLNASLGIIPILIYLQVINLKPRG
jgi:hypothetical protein